MSQEGLVVGDLRRFLPYPSYSDIDLAWLPRLPSHWRVIRLKHAADVRPSNVDKHTVDGEQLVRLCNYTDVYYSERITSDMEFMKASASREEIQKFTLAAGDVLITKDSETQDDIAVPAYVEEDIEGVLCGYHLAQIRPDRTRLLGSFLARCFVATGVQDQFHVAAKGITRFGISVSSIATSVVPIPPPEEQHAIADFLDRETSKIDALVAKKERLIELLREKRTALITHAVTKGLDPNAPMKPSGIQWLGDIPAHWDRIRVRHLISQIEQGWSPECEARECGPGEWGVLKAGCINHGRFNETEHKALPAGVEPLPALEVHAGDVLMSRASGSPQLIGSVAYVSKSRPNLMISDKIFRLRCLEGRVATTFLPLALGSHPVRAQIRQCISGAGGLANNLAQAAIKDFWLALPPLEEQTRIVGHAQRATGQLDALIATVNSGVDRLDEYRTALISAAVAGKIDVRGEVG